MKRFLPAALAASALIATATGTAFATTDATAVRLAGADRYATAHAVAGQPAWAPGGKVVVIANGESYSDALSAATVGGPVILTPATTLATEAGKALDELKSTHTDAVIVGGTASISDGVAEAIRAKGYVVRRFAGPDRNATAAATAREHAPVLINGRRTAIAVTSRGFTDALAAAPTGLPIVLVDQKSVPAATSQYLKDAEIAQVIAVGGTNSISDTTMATLGQDGRATQRVAGPSAAATAAAVADWEVFVLGWSPTSAILTSSVLFPDGLAGGALGAALKAPVLLAGFGLPSETTAFLNGQDKTISKVYALGGTRSVDQASIDQALAALKTTTNDK